MHVDLVGPLTRSGDYIYLLTCVDRFTRWPEAIPITCCTSEATAKAFLERWVAQYGCPAVVTTDRGSHFDGSFAALLKTLGTRHIKTTAYHPAANGMVERFHRQLKAALRAKDNPSWSEALPLVLLGLRSTIKADIQASPAELVYGCSLRLPGELVSPQPPRNFDYGNYVARLTHHMRQLRPQPPRVQTVPVQVDKELATRPFVFLRTDGTKQPLQAPYTGPHKVLRRTAKSFVIDRHGRKETVSIDRLKPAFVDDTVVEDSTPIADASTNPTPASSTATSVPVPSLPLPCLPPPSSPRSNLRSTRSRSIRKPVRFSDYVQRF